MHVQTRQQSSTETPSRVRLICLACTRQQLIQYRTWARTLSDPIELVAVDVPATVMPGALDPTQPASEQAKTLAEHLQPYLAQPHALFGQHQGAHVALALTHLAQGSYPGQTRHLFVSSCDSPAYTATGLAHPALQVPITVLYPPGALAAMLGWHSQARRALELIEMPAGTVDSSMLNQRLVRIFNTHLGLLGL